MDRRELASIRHFAGWGDHWQAEHWVDRRWRSSHEEVRRRSCPHFRDGRHCFNWDDRRHARRSGFNSGIWTRKDRLALVARDPVRLNCLALRVLLVCNASRGWTLSGFLALALHKGHSTVVVASEVFTAVRRVLCASFAPFAETEVVQLTLEASKVLVLEVAREDLVRHRVLVQDLERDAIFRPSDDLWVLTSKHLVKVEQERSHPSTLQRIVFIAVAAAAAAGSSRRRRGRRTLCGFVDTGRVLRTQDVSDVHDWDRDRGEREALCWSQRIRK